MHKMMELRDKLMDELEQQADRQLTEQSLELIDKLAHAIKCIDTIEAMDQSSYEIRESRESRESRDGYSGRRYREGGSREGYSGRRGGGSSRKRRNSMDGYSNDGYSNEYSGRRGYSRDEAKDKLIDEMEGMMGDVSPEAQHAIQKAIHALGQE